MAAVAAMGTMFTACKHGDKVLPELETEKGEVALFNKQKEPVAYIDYDDEATIYLWKGCDRRV